MSKKNAELVHAVTSNINAKREAKGWTVYRLRKEIGCTLSSIQRTCNGEGLPNVALLRDIAKAFGCSTDSLLKE